MMDKVTALDTATATVWAAKAHLYVLDALMAESKWTTRDIAFHGGTSLHFSWSSPRRSEDLDFLIARDVSDIAAVMRSALRRVQERFLADDPRISVGMEDKTKDVERMPHFMFSVTSSARRGKVKVKVEFWRVDREYLRTYPVAFRTPLAPGDIVSSVMHPVPAARLATAFADKLTAFATRPFLKWRDVYDLWWIGTQTREPLDVAQVAGQFLHNVAAYTTRDGLPPAGALRQFLARTDEEIFASAQTDLRPWLPEQMWERLYPDTVRGMVAYCRESLTIVADHIDGGPAPDDADALKRTPR